MMATFSRTAGQEFTLLWPFYHAICKRLYPKDILEIDLHYTTNMDKKSLSQSFFIPNAPEGRTYVVIDTFTEVRNTVQVHYTPIITSSKNVFSSFTVSGISELFARKVVLSSLGLVVYRSRLLRDLENVESD